MPGRFSTVNPPKRPGGYTNFVSKPRQRVAAPLSGIVAMPIIADWGPENTVVELDSMADAIDIYGNSPQSEGNIAIYQVFKGESINGKGGAAQVLAYRMVAVAGAEATTDLANTNGAPVSDAAVVTAVYKGTFGNSIQVALVANALDGATKQDLVVYVNGQEAERFTFTKATPQTLGPLADLSDYIRVTHNDNGDPLAVVGTPVNLTGGLNGETSTSTEYNAAQAALGTRRFSVFVPHNLPSDTGSSIMTALRTWAADPVVGHNVKGKRFFSLFGTGASVDLAAAIATAADLNSGDVGLTGAFTVSDSEIVDVNGTPLVLSPAQFAPRIAGIIAANGHKGSITFSRLADVSIVSGLSTDNDHVLASENGVLTVSEDSNALSPARIELDVTTYISDTVDAPKEVYSSVRFNRILEAFETRITEFVESNVIGRLTMGANTNDYVLGEVQNIVDEFVLDGAFQEGATIGLDTEHPPTDTDNFIALVYEVLLGRDVRQVRNTVVVG